MSDCAGMRLNMETVGLVNERLHLLSADQYQQLAETGVFDRKRVELIHGRVVDIGPMGDAHDWLVQRLNMVLVRTFGAVADIRPQLSVRASDDSMPEPDFLLVPKQTKPGPRARKGLLVIEIADSSLRFDSAVKAPLYAKTGTPEYWIIDARRSLLEVLRALKRGRYTERFLLRRHDVIRPVAFPHLELPLRTFL